MKLKNLNQIAKTNPYYQSKLDTFIMGILSIIDGCVGVISLGHYNSGYLVEYIPYVILKGIHRRKVLRGEI